MKFIDRLFRKFRSITVRPREEVVYDSLTKADIERLQKVIGYRFNSINLLIQAFKHRSYVYAKEKNGIWSNERLEFLGDAVLNLTVTEYLYHSFSDRREGDLTQIKSLVVSKKVLAQIAGKMGLGYYLLLSVPEDMAGGRNRLSILGDAYEALLGAIYVDGGIEPVRVFLKKYLLSEIEDLLEHQDYQNYKSLLLEYTQKEGRGNPKYSVRLEEGPDHKKIFTVQVSVGGQNLGEGRGKSKKEAQQMAAKDALRKLQMSYDGIVSLEGA